MKRRYLSDCMTWRAGVTMGAGPSGRAMKEHEAIPGADEVRDLTRGSETKPRGSGVLWRYEH